MLSSDVAWITRHLAVRQGEWCPIPPRFQARTIGTTEWDAAGLDFIGGGFRPDTYPSDANGALPSHLSRLLVP